MHAQARSTKIITTMIPMMIFIQFNPVLVLVYDVGAKLTVIWSDCLVKWFMSLIEVLTGLVY